MASSSSSGNAVNQLTASKLAFCTLNKFISSSFESSPHLRVRKLSQEAIDSLFNSVPVLNTPADEEFVKHIKQAASRFITLCTRSWIKQRNAALPRIFIPTGPNAATTVRFLARCIPAAAGSPSFSLEEASALLRACEKANKKRRENEFLTASILEPHMGMAQRCLQSDRDVSATMRAVFHLERAWKIHENHCRLRIPQKSPVPRLLALYLDARMRLTMQSGTPATDVVMNMLQKIVMGVFGVVVVQEKTWVRLMQDFGIDKRRVLVKVLQANRGVVEGNVRILGNQLLADQAMISATEESSGIVSSPLEAKDRWAFDLITGRGSRDIVTMVVLIQRALEVDADDKAARQVYEEACSDLEPSLLLENVDKMLLPLLRWYALRKDKEGCAWVINEMEQRGIWGTMKAFTVQACAYASTRDWELVKDLYDERVRAGLKPDIVFFAALVKIAADQSLPWVVEEWLGRMQERGVKPDSVTRKSAIIALAQNHRGQYPDLEFLRRAEEHLVALETEAGETEYEDVTAHYGILMRSYARLRNSAKVTDIMARYSIFLSRTNRHDNGAILDPELLDTYVYCLLDCNEWSLARDCLLELHSRRKQPASDRTKSCLCLLLESAPLEQLPLVDEVLQASDLRLVSKFGLAPLSDTSVNASLLIGRLARTPARDPDGSLERYARELWAALPREMSLNHAALTRAIKVCKTAKRARWWMDEFEAVDAEVRVNGVIQNAYLSICARDPEMRLAQLRALVTELSARLVPHTGVMKSKKMEVGTLYVVLTSRAAREGNVVAVEEILSEFESTRVMDDLDVRLLCSAPLLSVYTRATKYEKVDALWNDFCGDSITVPLLGHEAFVCLYLDSFGFRNDVEGLCSLWRTLIQKADEGAVVAGVEQFWKAPSGRFFITENHCNSYLEALLRVGACDEAVRTAKCMGAAASLHGSSAYAEASQRIVGKTHLARISPTRKMLVTILGGLETQKRWDLLREFDEWRKMAWTIMQ
ncbi:hypothetical protein BC830DRAFT_1080918 [Chytriomyces sp. MP71]|nr:hypothetical protein BC830DRAFT_1080918 [Chytriomyces sp. MP71]